MLTSPSLSPKIRSPSLLQVPSPSIMYLTSIVTWVAPWTASIFVPSVSTTPPPVSVPLVPLKRRWRLPPLSPAQ